MTLPPLARISFAVLALIGLPRLTVAQLPPTSADVSVVRYPSGARAPATWHVGASTLRIGGASAVGQASVVDVVAVFLLDSSRILIADGESSQLRIFNALSGQLLRTTGRRGQGPGEISDLWRAWRTPSGVVAEDAAGKASSFSLDGRFLRTMPRLADNATRAVERLDMFNDTLTLARTTDDTPTLAVGASAMSYMRLLAVGPSSSRMVIRYPNRAVAGQSNGRVRASVFSARSVAAVVNGRACVGYPAAYVIDCFTPLGRHVLRIERSGVAAERVSNAHREDFFASETAANPGPRGAPYVARLRTETPFADVMPLFGELVAASNGDLWVGPYVPVGPIPMKRPYPQRATTWSVFSADGRWKADAQLPARFQLFAVRDGRIAGVIRDEDDVEQVVIYSLETR